MVSSKEEGSVPSTRRNNIGVPPAPVTTTPWLESALATQAMMTVSPRALAPRLDASLPFEQ
jgi:hypothetical protein